MEKKKEFIRRDKTQKKFTQAEIEADYLSDNPVTYQFRMTTNEVDLFEKYVKQSKHYLEFGSGGSTYHALLTNPKMKVTSMDGSQDWIDIMRRYKFLTDQEASGRLLFHFTNIGPTGNWGHPKIENKHLFENYTKEIFTLINVDEIDTVLVDGRFRVACTLKTLLECRNNKSLKIMIHDFSKRNSYQKVYDYVDLVESSDTLFVFKPKKDIDYEKLEKAYNRYKTIKA